jgi:hypothetical protein
VRDAAQERPAVRAVEGPAQDVAIKRATATQVRPILTADLEATVAPIATQPIRRATRARAPSRHHRRSPGPRSQEERKPPGRQGRQVTNHRGLGSSNPGVVGVLAVKSSFSTPASVVSPRNLGSRPPGD